ncbi:MAG: hypothetical protein FWC01_07295, partial [Treponema sp.]|nr:hypothetical protein [Treponema sp.]MCL2252771.1 hypothetical protein [Treponema sp.]
LPLELVVQVFNINQGRNQKILKKSSTLNNYSFFVDKFHEYREYLSLDESAKAVVKYCIENNILKEFLETHGSEVSNMLYHDISIERIAEIRAKEAFEDGVEQEKLTIARNLLAEGSTPEFVQKITGLSLDEIAGL